jgi:hypothetical protein
MLLLANRSGVDPQGFEQATLGQKAVACEVAHTGAASSFWLKVAPMASGHSELRSRVV